MEEVWRLMASEMKRLKRLVANLNLDMEAF